MTLYRVQAVTTGVAGTPWYNNFYFRTGGNGTASDAAAKVAAFFTAYRQYTYIGLTTRINPEVLVIDGITGDVTATNAVTPTTITGNGTGSMAPGGVTAMIHVRTDTVRNNRRVVGTHNISGLTAGNFDAQGLVAGASATVLQNAAATLIAQGGNDGVIGAVWSRPGLRRFGPIVTPEPGAECIATSVSVPLKPGVIRSRRD